MKSSRELLLSLGSARQGFRSLLAHLGWPRLSPGFSSGKGLTHRERALARQIRVRPRSPLVRGVAGLTILSSFSLLWRPAFAGPTPPAPSAPPGRFDVGAAPLAVDRGATAAERIVGRLSPLSATWRLAGGDRPAGVLFDDDRRTALVTDGDAEVRIVLPVSRTIRGLGVYGRSDGRLTLALAGDGGKGAVRPIPGLEDLDLRALPRRWNRFWAQDRSAPSVAARDLVLLWRPSKAGTPLGEIELFGTVPDTARPQGAALADRLLAGTPPNAVEAWSEVDAMNVSAPDVGLEGIASFPVRFPIEPRLVDRAFLIYELEGLSSWPEVRRQVNGFSVVGGGREERSSAAPAVQVEEISPEWLFKGDNEIHFLPVDEHDPVGYRVRRLRVVAFPREGTPGDVGAGAGSSAEAARLTDGDPETGLEASRKPTVLTLRNEAHAQPAGLNLRVSQRLTGQLTVGAVAADGRTLRGTTFDAETLPLGWSFLPLDGLPVSAAVRVSWDAGREGSGRLSELRLAASASPEGAGRRLVVTHPLHGECVDHQVALRGYVTGLEGEPRAPELTLGGTEGALAADGAFSVDVGEPGAARGTPWKLPVSARFANGDVVTSELSIEPCRDRPPIVRAPLSAGPRPLIEDEGAPYGKTVVAGKAEVVELGGLRLEIPAGALTKDTRITVRPLIDDQVAPLDPMMGNVTPEHQGFRLGPHNLQFAEPVRISVPYDRGALPEGIEADELGVFFFDDQQGRWQGLPHVTRRNGQVLVAETTHFTDFIAATISRPDQPSPVKNTGKMFADLKAGNPAAGINLIAPPTPNSDGTARLTFPIDVPAGRNGMQPHLALTYDSSSQDGPLGVGWMLPISHIEPDSRFGVPIYSAFETDRYQIDGDELVMLGTKVNNQRCDGVYPIVRCGAQFRRRSEGRFEEIIRRDDRGSDGWQVTDRSGTVRSYGAMVSPSSQRNDAELRFSEYQPYYWALAQERDLWGNSVEYHYDTTVSTLGKDLTLNNITYTHDYYLNSIAPAFRVIFEYEDRPDKMTTSRVGFPIATTKRMSAIRVESRDANNVFSVYRRYVLTYVTGEFGKSLLSSVSVSSGGNPGTLFYTHKFDYNRFAGTPSFGAPVKWVDNLPSGGALGRGSGQSTGASGFVGLGPPFCYPHFGVGMSGNGGIDETKESFVDVNGDGLPDIFRGDGKAYLNAFASTAAGPDRNKGAFTTTPTPAFAGNLAHGIDWSLSFGLGAHFPGEVGFHGGTTSSHSYEDLTLADMNGDGFPDLFNGLQYACNNFPGSSCTGGSLPFSSPTTSWGGPTTGFPVYQDPTPSNGGSSFPSKMIARWTAPYSGNINLLAPVTRVSTNLVGVGGPPTDDVVVQVYRRIQFPTSVTEGYFWSFNFAGNDARVCFPDGPVGTSQGSSCNNNPAGLPFTVTAGDEFYFMVSGGPDHNVRNAVTWNPRITYTDFTCPTPSNPRTCASSFNGSDGAPLYKYDMAADHRLVGSVPPAWISASADTKPNGTRPVATTVRITGTITKTSATPDNVKFQAVKMTADNVRTVVWTGNMTAAQTGSISVDAANVFVDVKGQWVNKVDSATGIGNWTLDGDRLFFQVISDSPIDPNAITWTPTVTYQNYCYPDPADQQAKYLAVTPHVTPSPNNVNILCTNTPGSVIGAAASQSVDVQYPAFRYRAPAGQTAPAYLFNDTVNHTVTFSGGLSVRPGAGLDPNSPDKGQVVMLVHAGTRLLGKQVAAFGTSSSGITLNMPAGSFTVNGVEPLYVTVISYGQHTFASLPIQVMYGAGQTASLTYNTKVLTEPPLLGFAAGAPYSGPPSDPMSGGYHGWTYGVYNASKTFTTSGLTMAFDASNNTHPDSPTPSTFYPPAPAPHGLGPAVAADPALFGASGPLWRGRGDDDYIGSGVFHPSVSGSGAVRAGAPNGTGTSGGTIPPGINLRRSYASSTGIGGGAGLTAEYASGSSVGEIDLIDLNGDGIPDLLGLDRVLPSLPFKDGTNAFGPPADSFAQSDLINPYLRHTNNWNTRFGLGLGSIASQLTERPAPRDGTKSVSSTLPSFGFGYGISQTDVNLLDVNGDGLPDQVFHAPGSGLLTVRYGQGIGIAGENTGKSGYRVFSPQQTWTMPTLNVPVSFVSFLSTFGNAPASVLPSDGLQVQDNVNNSLQFSIMGIGGGLAFTSSRTYVDMIDMNGDGLPDRVVKQPGSSQLQIQFNTGSSFLAATPWTMPGWTGTTPIESAMIPTGVFGSNESLQYTQGRDLSVSAGFVLPLSLFFVCLVAEASVLGDTHVHNTQMTFTDINGDGLPDQVFKRDDLDPTSGGNDPALWVKLNPSGGMNLLKHVEGPLGGSFDVEYARAGNEVNIGAHVDDPTNHWVMSAVTVHSQPRNAVGAPVWNADPDQRTQFKYANGFYSRKDRGFAGFAKITSTRIGPGDQLVTQDTYDTTDVDTKGLLLKHVTRKRVSTDTTTADDSLPVFVAQDRQYETRVLQAPSTFERRAIKFIVEKVRNSRSYEGSGTNPDAATLTRQEAFDHENTYGTQTVYEDRGDTATTADDVKYTTQSGRVSIGYVVGPSTITATDAANKVLARRSATYFGNGSLTTVSDALIGGRSPVDGTAYTGSSSLTWTYNYSLLGVLNSFTDPTGHAVQVTAFDPVAATYPASSSDSLGYTWSQTTNINTGAPLSTTDVAGVRVAYQYDVHQRLSGVFSPIPVTAARKLAISYAAPMDVLVSEVYPARAQVLYSNPEQSTVVTMVDGWGRFLQVDTQAEVDNGSGSGNGGAIISGKIARDAFGRKISQGQPRFSVGLIVDLTAPLDTNNASRSPTSFAYDVLDRNTTTTFTGGRPPSQNAYDIFTLAGVRRARQVVTDSNNQVVRTYRDPRGNVMTVETPNTIAGVLKTLTTKYDYDPLDHLRHSIDAKNNTTTISWDSLGHMVDLASPDAGKTFYDYDVVGRLVRKQNAKGDQISYGYTNDRLDMISYPTSAQVSFAYGAAGAPNRRAGRLQSRTDESGTETYDYDNYGNVVKTSWAPATVPGQSLPGPYDTLYSYDGVLGTLRSVQPAGSNEVLTYTYNSQGMVKDVIGRVGQTSSPYAAKILYDEFGKRTRLERGNGVTTVYAYDSFMRRLDKLQSTNSGGTALQLLQYGYDQIGNVKTLQNQVTAPTSGTLGPTVVPGRTSYTFNYDNLYQLTGATGAYTGVGSLGGRNYSLTMAYDDIGNITSKNQGDSNKPTVGAAAQTVTATTYNATYAYAGPRPHAATTVNGQTGVYDADGNQLSLKTGSTGRNVTWNELDRMRTYNLSGGASTTYFYRANGQRAIKRAGTDTYYVNPYLTDRRGTSITYNIMLGDERLASSITPAGGPTRIYYYQTDHLQSSNYITDFAGTAVQHNEYFPFGETWVEDVRSDTTKNTYKYNGKEQDAESNLYYFDARYFDQRSSLWLSADPALRSYAKGGPNGGLNNPANLGLYTYAYNNPLTVRDPTGRSSEPPAKAPRPEPPGLPNKNGVFSFEEGLKVTPSPVAGGKAPAGTPSAPTWESGRGANPREFQLWARTPKFPAPFTRVGELSWEWFDYGHSWIYYPAGNVEMGMGPPPGAKGSLFGPTRMNDHSGEHLLPGARLVERMDVEDPEAVLEAMREGTSTGPFVPIVHDCHGAAEGALAPGRNGTGVDNDGLNNGTF